MSLIVPPWYFANETDNLAAVTPHVTDPGMAITPGTSNADGTAVTLLSALTHDVHYLSVGLAGFFVSIAAHYSLCDILIDPAGGTAWSTLVEDLVCGFTWNGNVTLFYHFPIYIPAGTSIGAQARTSHTVASAVAKVLVYARGNPSNPGIWWCGSGVETLGVTAASSIGTSLTPGNSGTWGSWTSIGSPTTRRYGTVSIGANGTDAGASGLGYHLQIGYGSVVLPGSPTIWRGVSGSESGDQIDVGPIQCDIPDGTQMQARATCSGTAEVWAGGVAIYGVY